MINTGEIIYGDLIRMLGLPRLFIFDDNEYAVLGYDEHNIQVIEWDFSTVFLYQAQNADPRKLYVIRDSFSTGIAEYIASQFNDSYWRHYETYTYDDLKSYDPDIVVYEVVERNVGQLGLFSIQ